VNLARETDEKRKRSSKKKIGYDVDVEDNDKEEYEDFEPKLNEDGKEENDEEEDLEEGSSSRAEHEWIHEKNCKMFRKFRAITQIPLPTINLRIYSCSALLRQQEAIEEGA